MNMKHKDNSQQVKTEEQYLEKKIAIEKNYNIIKNVVYTGGVIACGFVILYVGTKIFSKQDEECKSLQSDEKLPVARYLNIESNLKNIRQKQSIELSGFCLVDENDPLVREINDAYAKNKNERVNALEKAAQAYSSEINDLEQNSSVQKYNRADTARNYTSIGVAAMFGALALIVINGTGKKKMTNFIEKKKERRLKKLAMQYIH